MKNDENFYKHKFKEICLLPKVKQMLCEPSPKSRSGNRIKGFYKKITL